MTSVAWALIVAAAVVPALTTYWITVARASRVFERRARHFDERVEQQRVDALQRTASDRRAIEAAALELEQLRAGRLQDGMRAADRERQHGVDLARLEARAQLLSVVCRVDASTTVPLYPDRPAPIELDAISGRVRGLAFVDSVSIADASGLPLDRASNRDADDLAALVPVVGRVAKELTLVLGEVGALAIHTVDARVAEFRALPDWTGGAWLLAQSSSQRPPAGALDAAVAFARAIRDAWAKAPQEISLVTHGRLGASGPRTELLANELEQACRGLEVRTAALVLGDQILTGFQTQGMAVELLEPIIRRFHQLQQIARVRLRADAISRVEVDLDGAKRLSLSSLGHGSRLALVTLTVGRTLDTLEVERVVGRLRRFMDANGLASGGSGPTTKSGAYA